MSRPVNTDTIAGGTARSWEEWLDFLRSIGAQAMAHKEIAERIEATGDANAWWAQTITVAFEQHIGRRMPGQTQKGDHQLSVSRTMDGTMDEVMARWRRLSDTRTAFDEVPLVGPAEASRTDDWRYWRATLADGSRVNVRAQRKSAGRASLIISHEKIDSDEMAADWRSYWRSLIDRL